MDIHGAAAAMKKCFLRKGLGSMKLTSIIRQDVTLPDFIFYGVRLSVCRSNISRDGKKRNDFDWDMMIFLPIIWYTM